MIDRILEAKRIPSASLYAVVVEIYYQWKVRRQMYSGTTPISWDVIRDYCSPVIQSSFGKQDPLFLHIYALALAHLGEWSQANALYGQLRQANIPPHILWIPRDYLLHETGGVRTVQGIMRSLENREFFFCEDLQSDFHVDKKDRWPRTGETAHAAIQFSFSGPTAVNWHQ
jgi:hypothetical protein